MSVPFAALLLAAGVPSPDGVMFDQPAQALPTPVPLLHQDQQGQRTPIGQVTSLTWYHHLLVAHGTTTTDIKATHHPIPVGFEAVATSAHTRTHPDPLRVDTVSVLGEWALECLLVGEGLADHARLYGRLCAAPQQSALRPTVVYDHAWRLHPLRVDAWGEHHGPVSVDTLGTLPTPTEEALLALYADYRLALVSTGLFPDLHLLAHPAQAEDDPLRLTRASDGTWHYARASWGTTSGPLRPGRTLATLLEDVENADGTLAEWKQHQDRHATHPPHTTTAAEEQPMSTPNQTHTRNLDRIAGATTALHLRGVDGGDYTATRDDHTHLTWTITTPYTRQDLLLEDTDMAYGLLLRLAQGTWRLHEDGTDTPAQVEHTWLAVPHLSDNEGEAFEFSDGTVHQVVFVHAHHPGARARFELGACTRPDTADHCVQTRLTLEVDDGTSAEPLVYHDAQAQDQVTPAIDAPNARRFARQHRDSLRASPMTNADLWDGTRDGLAQLIAENETF